MKRADKIDLRLKAPAADSYLDQLLDYRPRVLILKTSAVGKTEMACQFAPMPYAAGLRPWEDHRDALPMQRTS